MKKVMILLLCMTLLLSLCACGSDKKQAEEPTQSVKETPATEAVTPKETEAATDAPETTPEETTEPEQDMVEVIRGYINKPIEELYELIGEPLSSDYASSCMGDGEDGLLVYDGFVVYTYREGKVETVYDVE